MNSKYEKETYMTKKLVLAYSGGLDTSYCAKHLAADLGYQVYTALGNTGGFSDEELQDIETKAYQLGVKKHVNLDVTQEYYEKCIKYMIYGNVLKNNTYPLSVSSERAFQAIAIIEYAKEIGAQYIAHGSTGAGNDQIRFDLIFQVLAPEIEIITPTRDKQLSREYEINYLKEHGFEANFEKLQYSINAGIWGTSIGGAETLTSHQTLPEEAYTKQLTKTEPETLTIDFLQGEIQAVNGKSYADKIKAIQAIEALCAPFAIGRDMHVGDTIIGIKGRVGFEAAAPLVIIKAHHTLEKHVLTKWQQHWKEQLGNWYGMLLHEAQYLEPVNRDIEAFLESTQKNVTGTVTVQLKPYGFNVVGIESAYDMMQSSFAEYGESNKAWTAEDVKGFTKIMSNALQLHRSVNSDK